MSTINEPTQEQVYGLVESYLNEQPEGLAFAIGFATGTNEFAPQVYHFGSAANQYGADLDLSPTTLFELGSLSKTFTATLCAYLGETHNKNWEKKTIGDYASRIDVGGQFHPIPLLALANYTSGLPTDNGTVPITTLPSYPPTPYNPAAMLGYLKGVGTATWKPTDIGKAYTYSNLAFSTLAQIIPLFSAKTASNDLVGLIKEFVFTPLSMADSDYFGNVYLDQLPVGYNYSSPSSYSAAMPGHDVFPAYYGGGGVVSTPNDMLTWLQFNMGIQGTGGLGAVLRKTQTASTKVTRPNTDIHMGLGWFLSEPASGPGTVFKDGGLPGCDTYMVFQPWVEPPGTPSSAGVFVLINANGLTSGGVALSQSIAESVLNTMLG
jgi:D-alanyl-D-alanine-carboxypeptidase/D-alanyl-D-alanine-endopeptidase